MLPPPRQKTLRPPTVIRVRRHARTMLVVKNLYSRKHHRAGHNLQVLTDQAGQIFYISEPSPGSTHDITAHKKHRLFGHMQPRHHAADKGYVGLGCACLSKERPGKPLLEWQKQFNKGINANPLCGQTIHNPPESMADTIHP